MVYIVMVIAIAPMIAGQDHDDDDDDNTEDHNHNHLFKVLITENFNGSDSNEI